MSEVAGDRPTQRADMVADFFTPARFAIILLLFFVASFPDVLLLGQCFEARDFGLYSYPVAVYFRESFWRGEVPLWNPYNYCGTPFLAQWSPMVLYPFSLIYLLLPLPWSVSFFSLAHLFLAGMGMYFLAHRWSANRFAASVAGLAFVFNGLVLNCLMWPHYTVVLGWMPWLVLAVQRSWIEGGFSIIRAGVIGALQMVGGVPEFVLMTWLLLGGLWLIALIKDRVNRKRIFARFFLAVLLVTGLAAAQLLPLIDLVSHSQRNSAYSSAEWSLPLAGWANFFVPLFRCHENAAGVYFQAVQAYTSSYYVPIGVLALAVFAFIRIRSARARWLGLWVLVCLALAFGNDGYVYAFVRKIFPPLGFVNFPVKFVMPAIFVAPLLASLAIEEMFKAEVAAKENFAVQHAQSDNCWRTLIKIAGLFIALILGIICFSRLRPFPDESWAKTLENGLVRSLFLGLITVAFFFLFRVEQLKRQLFLAVGILVLMWCDVITHAPRQNPTTKPAAFQPGLDALQNLKPKPGLGQSRALLAAGPVLLLNKKGLADPFADYLCHRLSLSHNCNLLDHIPKVDGFFTLKLREEQEFLETWAAHDPPPANLCDFLSISQMTSGEKVFEWKARDTFMPMITAGQKPIFTNAAMTLSGLQSPEFNPRKTVFLPTEAESIVSVRDETDAKIISSQFHEQRVEFEAEAKAPSLAVISQTYYHPWKVYIDGQRGQLWRANHNFQALEIPAGRHSIKLVYEDKLFYIGGAISIFSLLICVGVAIGTKRSQRNSQRSNIAA